MEKVQKTNAVKKTKSTLKWIVIGGVTAVVLFVAGFILCAQLTKESDDKMIVPVYLEQPARATIVEKTHFREAFIDEIKTQQELITLEVDLSEEIVLDDSWLNWGIFKKNQQLVYKGTGYYTVDLADINSDTIIVDDERKIILFKMNSPVIKAIEINEDMTEYYSVDNGLLRKSSEIKLTSSEQQTIMQEVKAAMNAKMESSELIEQAKSSANESITQLCKTILLKVDAGDYKVDVIFT